MTLVVSDVSRHGIVMVGDSAITRAAGVDRGAVKVQYSALANVGFALWGDAQAGGDYMDRWLHDFIEGQVRASDNVETIATKLITALNPLLQASGRTWEQLNRGIHLAGYRDSTPVLFHIHCGHLGAPKGPLTLHRDYPDDQGITPEQFRDFLRRPSSHAHLRNGYHEHFGPLFDLTTYYTEILKQRLNIDFPYGSLEGRMEFYKVLVRFVAGVLDASQERPSVNSELSCIAFTASGIVKNEMLPMHELPPAAADFGTF